MTVITTSTASTATAYSNQRKLDRTSNGVLWAMFGTNENSGRRYFRYSTDNGATWSTPAVGADLGNIGDGSASFFIDQDDYAHVVYKDTGNSGYIYYRRGTPNAGRTDWTWSAGVLLQGNSDYNYPDVVAHREGTGWVAHCVRSFKWSGGASNLVMYDLIRITSGGTVTRETSTTISADYGNTNHPYPSIDFHHTGDGKTIKDGTPHLYVAWSAGATGSGKGIRFKKATYSGGTWTWDTEREIDNSVYVLGDSRWLNCLFDGTRVIIGGHVYTGGINKLALWERDALDTTTTLRFNTNYATNNEYLLAGALTYDSEGNVYMFGEETGPSSGSMKIHYHKWIRATTTREPLVVIETTGREYPWLSVKRGHSNQRIEFIYTDGTASPYNVVYDSISLNNPPTINITTPTENQKLDPRVVNNVAWTYSDVDGNPQASWTADVGTPAPAPSSYAGGPAAQTGNIQTFTVPMTGTYTIEAIGAAGGQSVESYAGGKGAKIVGKFNLTAGQELKVIAGKPGNKPTGSSRGGSGGGASWVYKTGDTNPMVVAGGGGGAGNYAYDATVQDASITTAGKSGATTPNGYGAGGTGGNGGSAGSYGSGGAGWLTNGANGSSTTGGATPANGAGGGNGYNVAVDGGNGGFGGGGGSYAGAGGGGGYSGGGGGGWSNSGHGGGGGSYNAGTNQVNTAGVGTGEGSVTISMDSTVVFSTSGTTATNFNIPANSMADETNYEINLSVSDGTSTTAVKRNVLSDSWNYESEVASSTESGNWDVNQIAHGDTVEIQVATSDAVGFGPWSAAIEFINNNLPEVSLDGTGVFTETEGVVKWSYVDADGDVQATYQIRVRKKI